MAKYEQRNGDGKIVGFSSHPNALTSSVPVDEKSQDWLDYLNPSPDPKKIRNAAEVAPVKTKLGIFNYDDKSRERISETIENFEVIRAEFVYVGWPDDGTVPWVLEDNSTVPATKQELQAVKTAAAKRAAMAHIAYSASKG